MNKEYQILINQVSVILLGIATVFMSAEYRQLRAQETDGNTTIEEITEAETVSGEEVTVRGEIEEVESGVSFLIEEEDLFD
ncbi:MAG: hypothetical protein QNJ72_04185 [Pleurocapsa sp. MO_226.B13]|nr:hypothetical protein [Pleurocapsa sp. MO_226.B13]